MTNEMRTFLIGCFLACLPTAGMTQAEGLFQQTWIQQYSNGNSAYFENMALVDESIIACGQWFQGSMANQMVVSLQADNGEVNWQHYRDCCSDHARYYTPKLIDGTLYCFGTQNGQGSSYFDAMYVKYDVESGAELDYNIWNYGGSNGFTDVVVQNDGSFTVLSSAASVQPLARFVDDEIVQSGSISNQPDYQRLKGITERDGALYAFGAWEGYNYPGIIKLTSNLNVEWSRSVGSTGNRRVFCGLPTSDGFILGGRDHNLEHGFLVASDAEANLTTEVTFPPILYDKSSIGSMAAFEDGYLITLRDYNEDEVTTWLFALDEDLSVMAQIQLAPDMQFVNGSISGRPSAGQILLHNQDVYVTGYEKDGGFETPTMVKLAFQFNPIPGCTDVDACNFNPEANFNDDSCQYGCLFCGDGTVWDEGTQTCVTALLPFLNEPGEAAILNPCYFDSNGNGLVEVTDLMNVLSVYGMACGDVPAAAFSCGNPVSYHGYDYETVLIGEQCWFAENLRSSSYQNGDDIPGDLSAADWELTNQNQSGAYSIYGETDGSCAHFSPCIDPCDELASLEAFGKLYNWYAVNDGRNLCPSGWHVASDDEWAALEDDVVGQGFDSPGTALRSSSCWVQGNNGTDDVGFEAVPGGYRNAVVEGHIHFPYAGHGAYFWTASIGENSSEAWCRFFDHFDPQIRRESLNRGLGFSIRCVKD